VEKGDHFLATIGMQDNELHAFFLYARLSLASVEIFSKELLFPNPTAIFPGLDNRQTCLTLATNRRCLQTARHLSKVPDQHPVSKSRRQS
jgi:hypothetical protein